MKYSNFSFLLLTIIAMVLVSCESKKPKSENTKQTNQEVSIRQPADTIGFAQYAWQMDSIIARIEQTNGDLLKSKLLYSAMEVGGWKTVLSPHDDYAYVGYLYPAVLKNLKAKTIILLGVAHKASQLNLEDQLIFDSFDYWKAPGGNIKVSDFRKEIMDQLPKEIYQVNDSMQKMEHSVEALLPFIQYYNPDVEIVSILIPYMSYETMERLAQPLANAINQIAKSRNLVWGEDFALAISSDAVHYGDEGWGGKNFAFNGIGMDANQQTKIHEYDIMKTVAGEISPVKIKAFIEFTVEKNNYKEYQWTWCGRYSVPFGLLTSYYLQESMGVEPVKGVAIGYTTSIDNITLKVDDIGMGVTAVANDHHWVGYAAIGYR